MLAKFKRSDGSYSTAQYKLSTSYTRLDENLKVPSVGKFVQLKHWDELGRGDNKNAYPEMFTPSLGLYLRDPNGREYSYVEMPEQWQWFLWGHWKWSSQNRLPEGKIEGYYTRPYNFRTFAKTTPGSLTYVYVDMVEAHRAFTEAASPEAGAKDVVTKRNMSNPRSYEWLFNPTCGAMLKVVREVGQYYEIEALDVLKPPPSVDYVAIRPWLYFWCTQWSKYTGSNRFPQIKIANGVNGLPAAGISSPLMSKGGTIRVLKSSCRSLTNGQSWSPYAPI